jgi:pimeloyl-ACP methyl ester carboxylesterase
VVPYAHGRRFAEAVPGAQLVAFEGGGHSLPGREAHRAASAAGAGPIMCRERIGGLLRFYHRQAA